MHRRTARTVLATGALAALATGCGTTVPLVQQRTGENVSLGGPQGPIVGARAGLAAPSAQASSTPGDGTAPATLGLATPDSPSYGTDPSHTISGLQESGRGFTRTKVYIGFGTQDDASTFGAAFGIGASFGDTRAQVQAVVDDLNQHGGILGRTIVPVYHNDSAAKSNTDTASATQAACSAWTEDNHVLAAINPVSSLNTDALFACMAKHHTPLILSDAGEHASTSLVNYRPYLFAPAVMSIEHLVPVWVDRLAVRKFFTGWNTTLGRPGTAPVRIGLLSWNDPDSRAFAAATRKALAQAGLRPESEFVASGSLSTLGSEMANAVLQFQHANVTHVLSDGMVFFGQAAQQQQYHPRYGVTTYDTPMITATLVGASQLHGAMGVGYIPSADVDGAHDPGDVSPAQAHCRDLMRRAGQDTSSRTTFYVMQIVCETFGYLQRSLRLGVGLDAPALARGSNALGTAFVSAITFRSDFSRGRQDGAAAVRDLSYDDSCSCFVYANKTNQISH